MMHGPMNIKSLRISEFGSHLSSLYNIETRLY